MDFKDLGELVSDILYLGCAGADFELVQKKVFV